MKPDPVLVLRGHEADVQALEFDAREEHLLSGDANGELRVWNLLDARPVAIRRLHPVTAGIIALRLFDAGRRLATQGRDGVVHVWALAADGLTPAEQPERTFARDSFSFCRFSLLDPAAPPASAAAGEDFVSSLLAGGGGGGGEQREGGAPPHGGVADAVRAVHACAGAGAPPALLALPGDDGKEAEVVCCGCGATVAAFPARAAGDRELGLVLSLCLFVAPPGRALLAGGYEDGSVVVWDVAAAAAARRSGSAGEAAGGGGGGGGGGRPPLVVAQAKLHSEPVMALAVDARGAAGVCGSAEDRLVAFALPAAPGGELAVRHTVPLRKQGVADVALRPDGAMYASAGWDGRVRLYRARSGRPLAALAYHAASATAVAFGPRTRAVASGGRDGAVALWDAYAEAAPG